MCCGIAGEFEVVGHMGCTDDNDAHSRANIRGKVAPRGMDLAHC